MGERVFVVSTPSDLLVADFCRCFPDRTSHLLILPGSTPSVPVVVVGRNHTWKPMCLKGGESDGMQEASGSSKSAWFNGV